ncbi:MAG TPA: spermidine/putrescine ABC transporter substrate-binding protein [Gaiellaceae bacterium]|nr:spermidine/putrescine ABC transporter substrate-binding protein [Gaiellaceae bacterium]
MSDEITMWEQPVSRRGFVAGATAAALAAAGLSRFGGDAFAASEAAAQAEGTLFYYNWAQYVNPKTYAAFTKATGIKVKKGFYDSNETLHAKLKGGARGYDLVCPTAYMTKILIAEKRLQRLDFSKLPNVTRNADPKFRNTPDDPNGLYTVAKDWGTTGFMYRTDKIKERPTTWKEFVALTKKYSKTVMVDSSPEVVGSIATMLGYSYNTDDQKELDEVRKVLLDLKPHIVALHSFNYDTLIAKGKAWMGLGWNGDGLALAAKVPAQYVVAKEGGEIWIDNYNIPVGASNPDAAHAWMNFVYQPKIAGLETSYTYYGSPLKRSLLKGTAAGKLLADKVVFPPTATVRKLEFNKVSAKGTRLRERIWTEFKAS